MKVVLLKDVAKVGKKYEVKTVADGYALNFLLPRHLAETGTEKALKKAETMRAAQETDKKVQEELLMKNLEAINDVTIEISEKANEKGHLFASISKEELATKLKEQTRMEILPEHIELSKSIKEVGEHKVGVNVQDKTAMFKVVVTSLAE
jgi:large subunit ribosomal protein L9